MSCDGKDLIDFSKIGEDIAWRYGRKSCKTSIVSIIIFRRREMSDKLHWLRSGKAQARKVMDTNPVFQNLPPSKIGKKKINLNSYKMEFD